MKKQRISASYTWRTRNQHDETIINQMINFNANKCKQAEQEGQKRGHASNQRRNGETHQQLQIQTNKLLRRAFWA